MENLEFVSLLFFAASSARYAENPCWESQFSEKNGIKFVFPFMYKSTAFSYNDFPGI